MEFDCSFDCGVDDPAFHSLVHAPSVAVAQDYETEEQRIVARQLAHRDLLEQGKSLDEIRRLVDQDYGSFVSLSTPEGRALAQPMRIGLVWDLVDTGDYSPGGVSPSRYRQCSYVGECVTRLSETVL